MAPASQYFSLSRKLFVVSVYRKIKKKNHSVIVVKDFQCDLWLIIWLVICAFLGGRSEWLMTQNLETYFHVIALVLKTKMSSVLVNCFT